MARYITGLTFGRYFHIHEEELRKVRDELMKTDYIIVPETKKHKITSNFWYDLDYLLNRFTPKMPIPKHLIY